MIHLSLHKAEKLQERKALKKLAEEVSLDNANYSRALVLIQMGVPAKPKAARI